MLNIPTAQANRQTRRAAPTAAAPTDQSVMPGTPQSAEVPGATSLTPTAPTALSQTTPYEYANTPWNDPVAQSTMKSWYENPAHGFTQESQWNPGGGTGFYERSLANAKAYDTTPGVYHSEIDPARFTPEQKEAYIAGGGTYYGSQTPAQAAGVPYFAATGEPAPVMNMATGVAENPLTKQPMQVGGTGSFNTLAPDVINRMWR